MNIFDTLKQIKNISPDPAFTETSKRAILAIEPREAAAHGWFRAQRTILRIIETGSAFALAGFFIMIITGVFNGSGLSPKYSAIDPGSLKAEAQAIDIQIQLSKLNYSTPSATIQSANETADLTGGKAGFGSASGSNNSGTNGGNGSGVSAYSAMVAGNSTSTASSTASSSAVSIDDALRSLSQ